MKKLAALTAFLFLSIQSMHAIESDPASIDMRTPGWHILFQVGAQSFLDEWMQVTYGLAPYVGCEFSTRVSPVIDGIAEMGFCRKNGTYLYQTAWNGNGYDYDTYHFKMMYGTLGLGLRFCDRRIGQGSPFAELGFDVAHVREQNHDYSESGSAIGTHIAAGYWVYVSKQCVIQAKGKFQFLGVLMQSQVPYARHYEVDLSGLELTIGVGFGK